jgi:hypothetical protein
MIDREKTIKTAGGRIECARCQATSKRTKQQCGRPAMRGKRICNFHGGRSFGPKTNDGKERSRQANLKSGEYTKESMLQRHRTQLQLAYLEDISHLTHIATGSRTKGPKPKGYAKLSSLPDLLREIEKHKTL